MRVQYQLYSVGRMCLIYPFSIESVLAQLRQFMGEPVFCFRSIQSVVLFRGQIVLLLSLRKAKNKIKAARKDLIPNLSGYLIKSCILHTVNPEYTKLRK